MSYTQKVKKEIMKNEELTSLEILGEICSVIKSKNAIFSDKIEIKMENITLASRFYGLLQEATSLRILIKYSISKKFGEHKVYTITVPKQKGFKEFIGQIKSITNSIIVTQEELLCGNIRGYFIYSGYVKDPTKEYAMDFFIDSQEGADDFYSLLLALDKKVFQTIKKSKFLVYLRNSEDIMDLLVNMGSMKEFFKYEETTMMKDLKNKTIREMNWEVANETKTLDSANKQIRMIDYIDKVCGLGALTSVIEEVAQIRLKYTESSLQEIADIIGISKSGVKNRFRRLEDFYKELIEEEME